MRRCSAPAGWGPVLAANDGEKTIADRAPWRADELGKYYEGKPPRLGCWEALIGTARWTMCQLLGISSNREVDIRLSFREWKHRGDANPHGYGFAW